MRFHDVTKSYVHENDDIPGNPPGYRARSGAWVSGPVPKPPDPIKVPIQDISGTVRGLSMQYVAWVIITYVLIFVFGIMLGLRIG